MKGVLDFFMLSIFNKNEDILLKAALVFSKAPVSGEVKTRLVPDVSYENAALLHEAFVLDTVEKIAGQGSLDLWGACSPDKEHPFFVSLNERFGLKTFDQTEGDLGQRMKAGIDFLNCRGYEKILVLGSDSPSLPMEILGEALEQLDKNQIVLGPSIDGGYYLLGVCGEPADIFSGIEWGSSSVFNETLERLKKAKVKYSVLPYWYDVDTIQELRFLSIHLSALPETHCPETRKMLERLKSEISSPDRHSIKLKKEELLEKA